VALDGGRAKYSLLGSSPRMTTGGRCRLGWMTVAKETPHHPRRPVLGLDPRTTRDSARSDDGPRIKSESDPMIEDRRRPEGCPRRPSLLRPKLNRPRLLTHDRPAEEARHEIDQQRGALAAMVEEGIELHHVERPHNAAVMQHAHHQMRLPIGEAPGHQRTSARRNVRV